MGYQVKAEYWLKTEADKVEGILLLAKNWGTVWTAASLQLYLAGEGLVYTVAQVEAIGAELVRREVIEEV